MSDPAPSSLPETAHPTEWQAALADFAASRIALIRLESREASQVAVRKTRQAVLASGFALIAWTCLTAGAIGCLHHFTHCPWWVAALAFALFYGIAALVCLNKLKEKSAPLYPVTKAEFEKDRLWMQSLKTPK